MKLLDYEQIIKFLFETHKESNGGVDFILATYTPTLLLIRVSNGSVESDLGSTWIGDSDAFSEYQELYHSASPPKFEVESEGQKKKYEVISRISDALSQLVREGKHKSIGDFTISVRSSDEGFKYMGNAKAFPVSQKIPAGIATRIKFGTAQQGGYAYTVLWSETPNIGAVAVHYFQGNVGALYHPLERDEAIVYSGVTFEQFRLSVCNDYGLHMNGIKIS